MEELVDLVGCDVDQDSSVRLRIKKPCRAQIAVQTVGAQAVMVNCGCFSALISQGISNFVAAPLKARA